ncbi:hypothetical protein G6011_06764 [Alternaria panax]|uniref:CN hydrolase domain-containing protein n=1 Tax=Alternaria panax TaxID=48097 RepID=A0AAD4I9H9_9PLEO|nr:hypothetical protein G6011_06764 [Alternaria panax]
MPRTVRIAAAQVGAVHRTDNRQNTLKRLTRLLDQAGEKGAQVVPFPECTFTTFFPRYLFTDEAELESFFELDWMIDICIGFAEATAEGDHYNACIYYHAKSRSVLSKYRKVYLPGDVEPFPEPNAVNQLEKRYFRPGNLGFKAFRVPDLTHNTPENGEPIFGMMICNDRRWAEAWRCLGLQGVEVVLVGFNTPGFAPQMWGASPDTSPQVAREEAIFHHKLVMQAHSYANACFSISAARCGLDDGKYDLVGGSTIVGPDGRIIAESKTEEDEVIVADCDLDRCIPGKSRTFDFARHRRTEHYGILTSQTGVMKPARISVSGVVHDNIDFTLGGRQNYDLQSVSGCTGTKQIRILLCNPNATPLMTSACLEMLKPTLPIDVTVTGFTAPEPAPSAIEGSFDNIMSAAAAAHCPIVRLAPNRYSIDGGKAAKVILGHHNAMDKSKPYHPFGQPDEYNLFSEPSISVHAQVRRPLTQLCWQTNLLSYKPFVDSCNKILLHRLEEYARNGKALNVRELIQYYAFDVIGEITVGSRFGSMEDGGDKSGVVEAIDEGMTYTAIIGLIPE